MGKMACARGESTTFAIRGDKHSPNLLNRRAFPIRSSTYPNYSERELRRICGTCLTTMVYRRNPDNIEVGSGVREVATSGQYYSGFQMGEAEI